MAKSKIYIFQTFFSSRVLLMDELFCNTEYLRPLEPRCLKIGDAASYCGLTVSGYRSMVKRQLLPGPMRDPSTGKKTYLYDRLAIDASIDRLSGSAAKKTRESALEQWKALRNASRS